MYISLKVSDTGVYRSEKIIISGYYRYIIELLCTLCRGPAVAVQFVHRLPEFQRDECYESGHKLQLAPPSMLNHVIANPQGR